MNPISAQIDELYPEVVTWRRHMHRHPELGFQEFETTKWIIEKLEKWGYDVRRPCETGCVAVLKGTGAGENADGPVIALRADIDALPIDETGEAKQEFLSENKGIAHCCGHDVHTSNLLGTAKLLSGMRDQLHGTVVLIFQAGEELLPGGGRLLTETGILRDLNVQEIYGLHTNPNYKTGTLAVKEGPFMASTSEFTVEICGKGGHAASPHLAIDPIVISASVIQQIQSIVSRHLDPLDPAVITVGKITAGSARNIIPETAFLEGTIRTFSEEQTLRIFELISEIAKHAAGGAGGDARPELITGYPPVINHPETTRIFREAAGDRLVPMEKPIMAGEDFAFYQNEIPGTFFFLGSGSDEADSHYSWHHPRYNVDEQCMKTGMQVMATLVRQKLAKAK